MEIQYKLGDLLKSSENIIIHGCNAQGKMASGFAKSLREKHPLAYEAYMDTYNGTGLKVGDIVWAHDREVMIGNAITQKWYGRDKNVLYADYQAIRQVMKALNGLCVTHKDMYKYVGMPMIGAGLANGEWKIISAIIEEEAINFQPVVYVLEETLYRELIGEKNG